MKINYKHYTTNIKNYRTIFLTQLYCQNKCQFNIFYTAKGALVVLPLAFSFSIFQESYFFTVAYIKYLYPNGEDQNPSML